MTASPDPLALGTRTGLPDALRVLLSDHPREAWEADPRFHGLVSFWLERHVGFRHLLGLLDEDARALLDRKIDPRTFASRLPRLGGSLVQGLHGHHQIEDMHYFPVLAEADPRIAPGFEILDRDHHAIDPLLADYVASANAVLERHADPAAMREAGAAYHAQLGRLTALLDRHLTDEEELVVPVILSGRAEGLG